MSGKPTAACDECGLIMEDVDAEQLPQGGRMWCSTKCSEISMEKEGGWLKVSDISPEQLNDALKDVGLGLDGVGERSPS